MDRNFDELALQVEIERLRGEVLASEARQEERKRCEEIVNEAKKNWPIGEEVNDSALWGRDEVCDEILRRLREP